MKAVLALVAAFALLLAGCAGSQPQSPAADGGQQPPGVPAAMGNGANPNVPDGAQATPPAAAGGVQSQQANQAPPAPPSGSGNSPSTSITMPAGTDKSIITLSELALHGKEADCWVGYDGEVYDITTFIPNHKNYQALLVPLCGKADEFKKAFEGKHGMSKVELLTGQPLMGTLAQ